MYSQNRFILESSAFYLYPRTKGEIPTLMVVPRSVLPNDDGGNSENSFRILFDPQGGSFVQPVTGLSYGDSVSRPADPVRENYVLEGWFRDVSDVSSWDFSSDKVDGDRTLYAKWSSVTPTPSMTTTVVPTTIVPTVVQTTIATEPPTTPSTSHRDTYSFDEGQSSGTLDDSGTSGLLLVGVIVFLLILFFLIVYKQTYSGVMYSSGFGISLIAMALITTVIIIAIGSNIILSLGMVGALSIVRFRSAAKDPMDITSPFWAISAGIVLGAGLIPLAFFGSVAIGVFLLVFSRKKSSDQPFILVVDCDCDTTEKNIMDILTLSVKKLVLRSKTVRSCSVELTFESGLAGETSEFINRIATLPGVSIAFLVTYNGEYLT